MDEVARIQRVDRVGPIQHLSQGARNRFVVRPDALQEQSPFVVLVEDFIDPSAGFHPHPHRGLETAMIILDGEMQHSDHLGFEGVIGPGDVQWMTAGSGIVHDGGPLNERSVHALQLWISLPSQLRRSRPGTREQRLGEAITLPVKGGRMVVYGTGSVGVGAATWSRWPLTIIDVQLEAGGKCEVQVPAGHRMLAYVLQGSFNHPSTGKDLVEGDVVWVEVGRGDCQLPIDSPTGVRLMIYASQPIGEPVVARGPFVMGSEEEIAQAYADLKASSFLESAR